MNNEYIILHLLFESHEKSIRFMQAELFATASLYNLNIMQKYKVQK